MNIILNSLSRLAVVNFFGLLVISSFIPPKTVSYSEKSNPTIGVKNVNDNHKSSENKTSIFSEVKNHHLSTDCWVTYDGHIYDITKVFGSHVGGDTILLKYCGGDMKMGIETKEKNPPVNHSPSALRMLKQYIIY